jgi:penicillin amidase
VKSLMADTLVPRLTAAIEAIGTDPALAAYVGRADLVDLAARLAAWDRRFARDLPEPVIFLGLEWFAAEGALKTALTPALFSAIATKSPPALVGMLRNIVEGRFQGAETFAPDGVNALLLAALDKTASWLTAKFGAVDAAYTFGDVHAAEFPSEFGGKLAVDRVPVDGHLDTVNVSAAAFFNEDGAPLDKFAAHEMSLYRMVMGFGDDGRVESTLNFARGTREDPDDPHFDSQEAAWSLGEYKALPFRRSEVDASVDASAGERLSLPASR